MKYPQKLTAKTYHLTLRCAETGQLWNQPFTIEPKDNDDEIKGKLEEAACKIKKQFLLAGSNGLSADFSQTKSTRLKTG